MVAIKFLGLVVTFLLFFVLEAFGQNFYPARYGKRDENDSYQEKNLSENRRTGRSENQDAFNRKMGFFISGGRFGKRGCSENCFEGDIKSGSKEIISSGYQTRQDRSERIRIPIRKNQFMMGSRFGKRMDGQINVPGKDSWQKNMSGICSFGNRLPGKCRVLLRPVHQKLRRLTIEDLPGNLSPRGFKCIFIEIGDFYKCLEKRDLTDETDAIENISNGEFLQ